MGSQLCAVLKEQGHEVRAMVRPTSNLRWLEGLELEPVRGDLTDAGSLAAAVKGVDWVFHAGATLRAASREEFERVNYQGTVNLLNQSIAAGVRRLVFFSTVAASGPARSAEEPLTEEQVSRPVSAYGRSKLLAEQALQAERARLHSVVLRFPVVYGPADRDMLLVWRWLSRGVLPMLGRSFSIVYVKDAVRAAVLAAERATVAGSVYFITDGQCHSYDDVARAAEKVFGRRPRRVRVPAGLLFLMAGLNERLGRASIFTRDKARELACKDWVCSSERAAQELGYAPQFSLEQGLAETVRWYRAAGWL